MNANNEAPSNKALHSRTAHGVPAGIASSLERLKATLPGREEVLRGKIAEGARVHLNRRAAERAAFRTSLEAARRAPGSGINLALVNKLAQEYLEESAGKNGIVIRPSHAFHTSITDPGVPQRIEFQKTGDPWAHTYVHVEGSWNDFVATAFEFLLPVFGPVVGGTDAGSTGSHTGYERLVIPFDDIVVPDDGQYFLTALVGATGLYATQCDGFAKRAGVKVTSWFDSVSPPGMPSWTFLDQGDDPTGAIFSFGDMHELSGTFGLFGGQPLPLSVTCDVYAYCYGPDTHATIDMTPGRGGLSCFGCTLTKLQDLPKSY